MKKQLQIMVVTLSVLVLPWVAWSFSTPYDYKHLPWLRSKAAEMRTAKTPYETKFKTLDDSSPCDGVGDINSLIVDATLNKKLKQALKVSSITPEFAKQIDVIKIEDISVAPSSAKISSIDGIQCFTNLRMLTIVGHQISDLSYLSFLTKLSELDLRDNWISNIAPLAGLKKLEKVSLGNINYPVDVSGKQNSISDLSPLSGKFHLNYISLVNNRVANLDLTPLASLKNLMALYVLNSSFNDSDSWSNLLPLDLGPIAGLAQLRVLGTSGFNIKDLSILQTLPMLQKFSGGSAVQNSTLTLDGMLELESFTLGFGPIDAGITTLSLTNMPKLKEVTVYEGKLGAFTIANAPQLTSLDIRHNKVTNLSLSNTPEIVKLDASYNQLSMISLPNMPKLKTLYLDDNKLTSLVPLMPLIKSLPLPTSLLTYNIDISDNSITDITPLIDYNNALTCKINITAKSVPQAQWTAFNKKCYNL